MNLTDLRALLQVVEHGSFQRAALALRVPRTALRRHVERLEQELDVLLLVRGIKGISLTAAGQELADGAARLLQDAALLSERARTLRAGAGGVLRFVVPAGFPAEVRAKALLHLWTLHPELAVEVIEAEDPLAQLSEPFDLMLHFGRAPNREGWFSHVILRLPTRLRASRAYLEVHGTPASPEELDGHTLLQWSTLGLDDRGLPLRGGGSTYPAPRLRTANLEIITRLATAGAGIAYSPVLPPALDVEMARLVPVLEGVIGGEIVLRALTPRQSHSDPKIRAMLENIQHLLAAVGGARKSARS